MRPALALLRSKQSSSPEHQPPPSRNMRHLNREAFESEGKMQTKCEMNDTKRYFKIQVASHVIRAFAAVQAQSVGPFVAQTDKPVFQVKSGMVIVFVSVREMPAVKSTERPWTK